MTTRIQPLFTLGLVGLLLAGCQEDVPLTPTEIATDAPESALDADFDAEDQDVLQLDADIYVSAEEIAAIGEKFNPTGKSQRRRATTVYTQSNTAENNVVIAYAAAADGTLTEMDRFATGGAGTDENLANQGAVSLNPLTRLLYAVNAGSNELSVFYVNLDGSLTLLDKVATQGERPISVSSYQNVAYVVNAGSDNVEGFYFARSGRLLPLPESVRPLSGAGTNPAQISFTPNGRAMLVTEKATNTLTSYSVQRNGRLSNPLFTGSAGATPFGFDFFRGAVVVSEANMGEAGQGSVSVYRLSNNGRIRLLDGTNELNETATCWISANRRTGNIFATNTNSNTISSLRLERRRSLVITNGGDVTPAEFTVHDAGQNRLGTFLYVLTIGSDQVISYRIGDNGSLEQIDSDATEADFASGIAVYL